MNRSEGRFHKACVLSGMVVLLALTIWSSCRGAEVVPGDRPTGEKFFQFGGEMKFIGSASWPGNQTLIQPQGDKTFFDGLVENRLKGQFFFTNWLNFEVHNVIAATGGDTTKAINQAAFPVFLNQNDLPGSRPSDRRQFFNMSWSLADKTDYVAYDRVDRAALTFKKGPVLMTAGRQALTWGNGLVFQPLDLINPFSPTDVVREYKLGQDMAFAQISAGNANLQLLYAPRREPDTDRVKEEESAFASKLHLGAGNTGFDVTAAKNFGDKIVGASVAGYIGDAVWRTDVLYTWPYDGDHGAYVSGVANLDYSWTWWGKNWYGFVEVFYSGIGEKNYVRASTDPYIQKKFNQGTLFTLARWYADANVRLELHPLFNIYFTVISNVEDPSWIVQPRVTWDFARSFRLTLWGNIAFGPNESEYGGFTVPGTNLQRKPPNGGFAWLSYYF